MKYPKLDKSLWRSAKLTEQEKGEICTLWEAGLSRKHLAEEYKVSYATVYALTCSDEVLERIKEQGKKNDTTKNNKIQKDPDYRMKRNEVVSKSKKYRRKVNPLFGKFEWSATKKTLAK